jgi:CheY-specific phosphatase CheX
MMFDAEVEPSVDNTPLEVAYSSSVEIAVEDRFLMTIALHMPRAAAASTASWMVGVSPADVGDEDCLSVAGELGNMVAGRAHARFRERSMQSVCALPRTRSGYTLPTVGDRNGFRLRFSLPGSGDFVLAVTVLEAAGLATARAERQAAKTGGRP